MAKLLPPPDFAEERVEAGFGVEELVQPQGPHFRREISGRPSERCCAKSREPSTLRSEWVLMPGTARFAAAAPVSVKPFWRT